MNLIQKIGIGLFCIAWIIFNLSTGLNNFKLNESSIITDSDYHTSAMINSADALNILGKEYSSKVLFIQDLKKVISDAQSTLSSGNIPEGIGEWDYKIGEWKTKDYVYNNVRASSFGLVENNKPLFLFLTFGLGIFGGLLFILPKFSEQSGIKNDGIYHNSMTRGITLTTRKALLVTSIIGLLIYGIFYSYGNVIWPILSAITVGVIIYLVMKKEHSAENNPQRSSSADITGKLGLFFGLYLIFFYIVLYWFPEYITGWVAIADPVSIFLSGNPAGRWFLYGLLYSTIVLVMGIRMMAKYQHNKYQIIRTISVTFFQLAIAFILPEILVRLNQPWYDFKNIWPLNYSFFFDYNLENLLNSGSLGIFMLVWGIILIVIGVPVITYFYGKRWYCSWVCGCGGLAETFGDPYRQLSDKSLRAWKFERWIIHGVLVFAIVMTILVLYTYFSGGKHLGFLDSDSIRGWYGFLIGSAFAGVVGTGFYPLMGNRVWCRFGCPLAAYLGLVQKYKSRFRITTNGGQCISCGNCSTYCEMGIDVRWYAQKGQDIVRSSCVGCGVCSAVCPRGVLRLENASSDVEDRTKVERTIHISENKIKILN
jgi:polyferredoxin